MSTIIPGLKAKPFMGNLLDLRDEEAPLRAFEYMAVEYGPIYKLTRGGNRIIVVSSVEIMEELCDESRFEKKGDRPSSLFTATNDDPDWGQAHRILVPAFGPLAIEGMYDQMQDIGNQLLLKWARLGPSEPISVTDDLTRLTLDTIALCAMDFGFNSFYSDKMHPFVDAMVGFLSESGDRVRRPGFVTNMMINGKDPQTKNEMRDDLILANMITFLIAGHETISGILSFVFLNLMKSADAYNSAQREGADANEFKPERMMEDNFKNLPDVAWKPFGRWCWSMY
ncbi:hypothetical protein DID88_004106 [Monilinia fructigena]|uniref:Cytochrome P450 n=1 Tax=Monilinia fructigena TaxID=38457 RepID=A0A395IRT2_9HELO|nr:hypothetical protein DID88_004106 [Monilinia fructigena]